MKCEREFRMANCSECGENTEALYESSIGMLCTACYYGVSKSKVPKSKKKITADKVLLTTETAPNLKITRRIDVVTSQAAFEINNFKDMVVGLMNPVKGRANEMEKQIDVLKDKAMYNLKAKAHQLNANGVVGVDLDISTVTIGQISMLMLVASGTAVVIEQ